MISKKALIASILVVVILAGAYLLLTFGGQGDDKTTTDPKPSKKVSEIDAIFSADVDSFTSLSIKNESESYEIYLNDGVWSVRGSEHILFSQVNIKNTLFNYVSLVPTLIVDETSENAASYGFDKPIAQAEVKTLDGNSAIFYLGDKTKGGNGYYLMMQGDEKVYTVSIIFGDSMLKTLIDYRETTVISVAPEEITGIVMTVQGVGEVSVEKLNEQKDVMTSWMMTKPFEIGVYDDKFTEAVLTPITSVSAVEFISDNPTRQQLEESGLTSPEYYYEVKTADKSYRVDIGKSFDGYYIAKRSDMPSVYLLNPDSLSFLFTNILDYISSYVYLPEHADVSEIKSVFDGAEYIISNNDEIVINGNRVSKKTYSDFYQKFFGIELRGQVTTTPETTEPYFSYSVTRSDDSVDDISFVKMNSRYMYMFVNGKTEFYVYTEDVESAKSALTEMLNTAKENPYTGEEEDTKSQETKAPGGFKWLGLFVVIIILALIIVFPVSMLKNSGNKK